MKITQGLLWITTLFFITLLSCQTQPDTLVHNSEAMSNLRSRLSTDPVFKAYRRAFKEQASFAISQRYLTQTYDKQVMAEGIKNVHSKEDYFKLCEKAGVINAEKQFMNHYNLLKAQKNLCDKYPEIASMNKESFKTLMLKFDQEDAKILFPASRFSKASN